MSSERLCWGDPQVDEVLAGHMKAYDEAGVHLAMVDSESGEIIASASMPMGLKTPDDEFLLVTRYNDCDMSSVINAAYELRDLGLSPDASYGKA